MSDKQQLSEHQIRELTGRLSYVSGAQRDLVDAALRVVQSKRGGLSKESVKDAMRGLTNAGLISDGAGDSLMKKLFE